PFIKTDVAKMIIGQRKDKQENWHDKTEYVCHCTCIDIRFGFYGEKFERIFTTRRGNRIAMRTTDTMDDTLQFLCERKSLRANMVDGSPRRNHRPNRIQW
ncbi:hypothetical protein RDWZM_009174, partial [Blomia tropicalis]